MKYEAEIVDVDRSTTLQKMVLSNSIEQHQSFGQVLAILLNVVYFVYYTLSLATVDFQLYPHHALGIGLPLSHC